MQDYIVVKIPVRVARNGSREVMLNAIMSRVHAAVRDWCEMELLEYAPGGANEDGRRAPTAVARLADERGVTMTVECSVCDGRGEIVHETEHHAPDDYRGRPPYIRYTHTTRQCTDCNGSGEREECTFCHGKGGGTSQPVEGLAAMDWDCTRCDGGGFVCAGCSYSPCVCAERDACAREDAEEARLERMREDDAVRDIGAGVLGLPADWYEP